MKDKSRIRRKVNLISVLILIGAIGTVDASNAVSSRPSQQMSLATPSPVRLSSVRTRQESEVIRIIETEVWDESTQTWKALSDAERWSNEWDQISQSPNEAQPPLDWDFDGDWKIVLTGPPDTMGWEYSFHYLGSPTRKRVWLRNLKAKSLSRVYPSTTTTRRNNNKGLVSRALTEMRNGYNFKGFTGRVYKSLLSDSFGFGISVPLSMNFDFFDRNPSLPSISSTFGCYFPLTLSAAVSASIHVETIRWAIRSILFFLPRLALLLWTRFALPTLWAVATAALLPLGIRMPTVPEAPVMLFPKPYYSSDISERIGCSLSYRWSKDNGFEWRFNYWHSCLPTFAAVRRFLGIDELVGLFDKRKERPIGWLEKYSAAMGVSTSGPQPLPPHYSCAVCLAFSGWHLMNPAATRRRTAESVITGALENEPKKIVSNALEHSAMVPSPPSFDSKASMQEDRHQNDKVQHHTKHKAAMLVTAGIATS